MKFGEPLSIKVHYTVQSQQFGVLQKLWYRTMGPNTFFKLKIPYHKTS